MIRASASSSHTGIPHHRPNCLFRFTSAILPNIDGESVSWLAFARYVNMFADFARFAPWRVSVYCLWPGIIRRVSEQILKCVVTRKVYSCRSLIDSVIYFAQAPIESLSKD